MSIIQSLAPKPKKQGGEKTRQYNGSHLPLEDVAELAGLLGVPANTPGSLLFDMMVAEVTGAEMAPPEESDAKGKYIGKSFKLEGEDVFESHPALCKALGIPVTTGGSAVFRTVLIAVLHKRGLVDENGKPVKAE